MTSSLVGSEMCIRDSVLTVLGWMLRRCMRSARCPYLASLGRPDGMGEEAVSYTHLTLPTICSV
eukprot:7646683-Prorocentrum_lima.AAC.1